MHWLRFKLQIQRIGSGITRSGCYSHCTLISYDKQIKLFTLHQVHTTMLILPSEPKWYGRNVALQPCKAFPKTPALDVIPVAVPLWTELQPENKAIINAQSDLQRLAQALPLMTPSQNLRRLNTCALVGWAHPPCLVITIDGGGIGLSHLRLPPSRLRRCIACLSHEQFPQPLLS